MVDAVLVAILVATLGGPQLQVVDVPAAAKPFVAPGTRPLAFETADLNRDGRLDAILVLDPVAKAGEDPYAERPRPLLILVGQPDGAFREAARNAKVAYCSACGGVMGDPFQGVSAATGTFTVTNAGGSNWRWDVDYTFNYSRRDDSWQLVRVREGSFHTSEPNAAKNTVSRPPKDFGKIDIATFDPENWKNQGPR